MKRKKMLAAIAIILNVLGVICLIWFAVPYLRRNTAVAHPQAMLPAERWDGAGMALTFGFIPLLAANILLFVCAAKAKPKPPLRLLCFAPSAVCLGLVASYWITSLA